MKIAVLCWGSTFWDKGSLKTTGEWKSDGPELALEFCRISSPGKSKERLTPVLSETGTKCQTLWDFMEATDLKSARNNLRDREGAVTDDIDVFTRNQNPLSLEAVQIDGWLIDHPEIDAVVWTGVKSNWQEVRRKEFSEEELVKYLESKKSSISRIKEQFDRSPVQIQTVGKKVFYKWLTESI